jgi:hypothetical protein
MHKNPEQPLYTKAKIGMVSLLREIAFSFLVFALMLIITEGNPPQWVVAFTFCIIFACVILEEFLSEELNPFLIVISIEFILLPLKVSGHILFSKPSVYFPIVLSCFIFSIVQLLFRKRRKEKQDSERKLTQKRNFTHINTTFNGGIQISSNIVLSSEQLKIISHASKEIQYLLKELEKTSQSATDFEKIEYINSEIPHGIKQLVVKTFQSSEETAIEQVLNRQHVLENQYVEIGEAIIKGWINREAEDTG